jgi:hypothetical protein
MMALIKGNPSALSVFRLKLIEAGYFDQHKKYYEDTGYTIRQKNIYKVTEDFPKITENMIPAGVGDVRYSVVVSVNDKWVIEEEKLIYRINKAIKND